MGSARGWGCGGRGDEVSVANGSKSGKFFFNFLQNVKERSGIPGASGHVRAALRTIPSFDLT